MEILDTICSLCEKFKSAPWFDVIADPACGVKDIAAYLGTNDVQAALFSVVFVSNYEHNKSVALDDIAETLGMTPLKMLKYKNDLLGLCDKGLCITVDREEVEDAPALLGLAFSVAKSASECILDNRPVDSVKVVDAEDDMLSFLNKVSGMLDPHDDYFGRRRSAASGPRTGPAVVRRIIAEEEKIKDNEHIKTVCAQVTDHTDRVMFYQFCYDRINNRRNESDVEDVINCVCGSPHQRMEKAMSFMNGTNVLVTAGLVEFNPAEEIEDATVDVTDDGLRIMLGDEAKLYERRISDKDLIRSEKIPVKELFFSSETEKQLAVLRNALDEKKFRELKARLAAKGLAQGIAVLLYGGPGTGKTETVYQMAKAAGRDIYHVDISESKSCFFGESQKRIKSIFRKYSKMCTAAEKAGIPVPVLLFNEADAVISKRKDANFSNVAQEENAMQNIILEEMENLKGVMVATTNLADNLDEAFERRFLFKIHFDQPSVGARAKIWMSKLESLSEHDAETLAEQFHFSGGEIDNIVRKIEIENVISGTPADIDAIEELCRNEKLHGAQNERIGFRT